MIYRYNEDHIFIIIIIIMINIIIWWLLHRTKVGQDFEIFKDCERF